MKIVFWGTPDFAVPSLKYLYDQGHQISCVITQPDKRRGRGKNKSASPIKKAALELCIPVLTTYSIKKDESIKEKLKEFSFDIFIVVAFGQILPLEILDLPRLGCWNSHASLLPRWRGAAPIEWSIANGDIKTGVCIMLMEEGLDTGPVLIKNEININLTDNKGILTDKLSKLSSKLLIKAITIIDEASTTNDKLNLNKLDLQYQINSNNEVTYARQINKNDKLINWNDNSLAIHKRIMAFYPNSYSIIKGKILKIEDSYPLDEDLNNLTTDYYKNILIEEERNIEIGQFIYSIKGLGVIIRCGNGYLIIKKAKLEGKSSSDSDSLIQQLSIYKGEILS